MAERKDSATHGKPVETAAAPIDGDRLAALRAIVPEAFDETGIDFEKLKLALGGAVDEGKERYGLSWSGKAQSVRQLMLPSRATLVPDVKESVNFDTTRHVFIEGENLEVLKLLRKSYAGRVKMIYIDPPYNTDADVIYDDNFSDPTGDYLRKTGQTDENGNWTVSTPEIAGRKHSRWLSMIYPRLLAARDLMRDDGVIFVSIDDHEVHNLDMVLSEVFSEENWVTMLVWEKGRKNDSTFFSESVEYMLAFARNRSVLAALGEWRAPKQGFERVLAHYDELLAKFGTKHARIEEEMRKYYATLPKGDPAKQLSHFWHSDARGLFFGADISSASTSIPDYEIRHPTTKRPVKKPSRGWGATEPVMKERIADDRVLFGKDETTIPLKKSYLKEVDSIVLTPVIYKDGRGATNMVEELVGAAVFDAPKDHEVLADLLQYAAPNGGLVMDFFAGSASTGHAVWEAHKRDGKPYQFLLVQMAAKIDPPVKAGSTVFATIDQVSRTRLRAAGKRMQAEAAEMLGAGTNPPDLGFRAFRFAESHYKRWAGTTDQDAAKYIETMALYTDPLLPGWKPEGVLWEVALKAGYPLHSTVETLKEIKGQTVYRVTDPDKGTSFLACFDKTIAKDLAGRLKLTREDTFVVRDAALDDTLAANLALTCTLRTI